MIQRPTENFPSWLCKIQLISVKFKITDTKITGSNCLHTQTSAFEEYGRSWHISGAKQHGVPINVDATSNVAVIRFAMPKSPKYSRPPKLPALPHIESLAACNAQSTDETILSHCVSIPSVN